MEQNGNQISFSDDERILTGLPESITEDQLLDVLDTLNSQVEARTQQLEHMRGRGESYCRGMIPIAEGNLLLVGGLVRKLSGIAAPQIIEKELKDLTTEEN